MVPGSGMHPPPQALITRYLARFADTISVCFSKALGAPVGSMVLSSRSLRGDILRKRKMWGGGMRQVGVLASAAAYALKHHLPLLSEDHRRARELAAFFEWIRGIFGGSGPGSYQHCAVRCEAGNGSGCAA